MKKLTLTLTIAVTLIAFLLTPAFAKKEKLIGTALSYLNSHKNMPDNWRTDFVGVELDENGKATRIELIENAVS